MWPALSFQKTLLLSVEVASKEQERLGSQQLAAAESQRESDGVTWSSLEPRMAERTQVTGRLFRIPSRTMEGDVSEEGVGSHYWIDTDALSREETRI